MENCTGVDRINTSVEEILRDRGSKEVGELGVDRIEKDRRNKERGKGKERKMVEEIPKIKRRNK